MENNALYKIRSIIFGHAVADALGVPVEFREREELDADPVKDMRGYGTYPYGAGAWSDDTSMTLCALDSLADGKLDFEEIMRNFTSWLTKGEYTSVGVCFDAGRTCVKAICDYNDLGLPAAESGGKSEYSNGNGSLMRILPFILWCEYAAPNEDERDLIFKASAMTHAHERSQLACAIYAKLIRKLLNAPEINSVYSALEEAKAEYGSYGELRHYRRIFAPDFKSLDRSKINSSGYVVNTLEAAVWCLLTTDNYKDCVLKAVNLGEDTDTVAAVVGGLAGALYGFDSIPKEWLDTLMRKDFIDEMCIRAYKNRIKA